MLNPDQKNVLRAYIQAQPDAFAAQKQVSALSDEDIITLIDKFIPLGKPFFQQRINDIARNVNALQSQLSSVSEIMASMNALTPPPPAPEIAQAIPDLTPTPTPAPTPVPRPPQDALVPGSVNPARVGETPATPAPTPIAAPEVTPTAVPTPQPQPPIT